MSDSAEEPAASFSWTRRHVLTLVVLCLAALLDTVDVTRSEERRVGKECQ